MDKVFCKINDALGGTAVYEGASSSNDAFYFTHKGDRYTLAIFGDLALLTNITRQDYLKLTTSNLSAEIIEAVSRWQA
jgi:hypothetical protein